MNIGDWRATRDLNPVYRDIRRLDLERNTAELEAYGFTLLEPGKAAPLEFCDQLLSRIVSLGARKAVDRSTLRLPQTRGSAARVERPRLLLFQDRIFEEALMNEAVLTLITYLLGEACVLSSFGAVIEGPSEGESTPRTDNAMIPSPFPPYAQVAQATWVLSDESQENGAELVIPGSHRFYRHPPRSEALAPEIFVPVKAARGSVIVWHGNLWHRSIPRSAPCPRAELSVLFCRMYCRTQEQYRSNVPREILGRQSERFGRLMGEHIAYGWTEAGPDFSTEDRRKYLGLERDPGERLYD